jgi:CO/xanthine dehydrogenase Mo-binding subunit
VVDTGAQPYSGQAGGSRTTYVVGSAVGLAASEARRQLLDLAADLLEASPVDLEVQRGVVSVVGVPSRRITYAELVQATSTLFQKMPHPPICGVGRVSVSDTAPMATVQVCKVKADAETGAWKVAGFLAIQDVGHVINRPTCEGQVRGGALQSAARAIGEAMTFNADGLPLTASFVDYGIPTIDQAPECAVELVEVPSQLGPLGARGAGEPPAIPACAAVANALRRATGLRLRSLPVEFEAIAFGEGLVRPDD